MAERKAIPARVMVIDDNDVTRTLLRGILTRELYQLAGEANNGEQGLEMVLLQKPDLVCLDIQMPKMDGLEVLQKIKEQLPFTSVVMITGSTERETVETAIEAGADGYVVKPFNLGRVVDTVSKALAKQKSRKDAAAAASVTAPEGGPEEAPGDTPDSAATPPEPTEFSAESNLGLLAAAEESAAAPATAQTESALAQN